MVNLTKISKVVLVAGALALLSFYSTLITQFGMHRTIITLPAAEIPKPANMPPVNMPR